MLKKNALLFTRASLFLSLVFILQSCDKVKDYLPHGGSTSNLTIAAIVAKHPDFTLLKVALEQTGLTAALNQPGALTVFAPDNRAFAAAGFANETAVKKAPTEVLKGILLYHVLGSKITASQVPAGSNTPVKTLSEKDVYVTNKSGKVSVNGASVTKADIMASNGVIHVINKVLIPPAGNIVDVVAGNPDFSFLLAAVLRASQGATNVAGLLSGAGPLTVFAPTNQAFKNAGLSTIESINGSKPDDLTAILAYHVISARVFSTDLVNNAKVGTVNGEKVTIRLGNNKAAVKGKSNTTASVITAADLVTTNGVVHVIDQVLLP